MPQVNVYWLQGKTEQQKKEVAQGITEVMVRALGVRTTDVVVHMIDLPKANISVGGSLFSEMQ